LLRNKILAKTLSGRVNEIHPVKERRAGESKDKARQQTRAPA